jgi:hypothetical protein
MPLAPLPPGGGGVGGGGSYRAILTRIKQSPPGAAAGGPSHSSLRDIHTGDRASLYKVNRAALGRRLEP